MGTNANIDGTMTTRVSVDVELLEHMEKQQEEISELRAQLSANQEVLRCAEEMVNKKDALSTYTVIGLSADDMPAFINLCNAVRAAKEARE